MFAIIFTFVPFGINSPSLGSMDSTFPVPDISTLNPFDDNFDIACLKLSPITSGITCVLFISLFTSLILNFIVASFSLISLPAAMDRPALPALPPS